MGDDYWQPFTQVLQQMVCAGTISEADAAMAFVTDDVEGGHEIHGTARDRRVRFATGADRALSLPRSTTGDSTSPAALIAHAECRSRQPADHEKAAGLSFPWVV